MGHGHNIIMNTVQCKDFRDIKVCGADFNGLRKWQFISLPYFCARKHGVVRCHIKMASFMCFFRSFFYLKNNCVRWSSNEVARNRCSLTQKLKTFFYLHRNVCGSSSSSSGKSLVTMKFTWVYCIRSSFCGTGIIFRI